MQEDCIIGTESEMEIITERGQSKLNKELSDLGGSDIV